MKKLKYLPEFFLGMFFLLLLYITFVRKIAFVPEHIFFNFVLLLPTLAFFVVFKLFQQLLKGTKMEKLATFGLLLGVLLFDILLVLTCFIL